MSFSLCDIQVFTIVGIPLSVYAIRVCGCSSENWKRRNGTSVEHYTRPKMRRIHHNENANTVCYTGGLSDWSETTNHIVGLCLHFGRPCRTPYISIEIEFNNVERLYFRNNKTSTSSARRSVNGMAWDIISCVEHNFINWNDENNFICQNENLTNAQLSYEGRAAVLSHFTVQCFVNVTWSKIQLLKALATSEITVLVLVSLWKPSSNFTVAYISLWINCRSRPNDDLREQQCRPGVF